MSNPHARGTKNGGGGGGGLVGIMAFNGNGTISNSSAKGNVVCRDGKNIVGSASDASDGALVGYLHDAVVKDSYALGNVTSFNCKGYAGGLVGKTSQATVRDSYARGNVISNSSAAGGLIGRADISSSIVRTFSTGKVLATSNVGGLVGIMASSTVTASYWDVNSSEVSISAGGTGKTTNEMKNQSTYAGWDFSSVWEQITPGASYLSFQWQATSNCGPLGCSPPVSGLGNVLNFVIVIHAIVLGALIGSFLYLRRKEKREQALARYSMNSSVLNKVGREHLKY